MELGVKCHKCQEVVSKAMSYKASRNDEVHRMVCLKCYNSIKKWRKARGYDMRFNPVKKEAEQ